MLNHAKLRAIESQEIELMLSWRNSPEVREKMYTRHEISTNEHREWWEKTCTRRDQKYFMFENNEKPQGIVGFTSIDTENSNSSWAFYAAPDAPKGTGSLMEFLALEHSFSNMKLHKLYCEVLSFNKPVINMHQKFGFQIEGTFRQHHFYEDKYIDVYRLGLLASEWIEKRVEIIERLNARKRD